MLRRHLTDIEYTQIKHRNKKLLTHCDWPLRRTISLNFKTSYFEHWDKSYVPVSIFTTIFAFIFITFTIAKHLCIVCHHFIYLLSLFQGFFVCRNFSPTRPQQWHFFEYFKSKVSYLVNHPVWWRSSIFQDHQSVGEFVSFLKPD